MDVNEELKFLGKFTKKNCEFFWGCSGEGGGCSSWGCSDWGDQGGCERRIGVFVKIQKKIIIFFLGGGVRVGGGVGLVGGSGWM